MKPQLIEDYVETGQVYMEYRDFAHLGEESARAAEAAACAADQDAYWDYNQSIYLNHQTPPMNDGGYSDDRLVQMAEVLELDVDAFESCLDDGTYQDRVEESTQAAQEAGVSGTPGFQINGDVVEWENYEQLSEDIEAELDDAGN